MHYYHISVEEVKALPLKTFWLMSASIDRIEAKKDMRALTVAVCGQGGEAAQSHRQRLELEVGTVVKLDESPLNAYRDTAGFEELRAMTR